MTARILVAAHLRPHAPTSTHDEKVAPGRSHFQTPEAASALASAWSLSDQINLEDQAV